MSEPRSETKHPTADDLAEMLERVTEKLSRTSSYTGTVLVAEASDLLARYKAAEFGRSGGPDD